MSVAFSYSSNILISFFKYFADLHECLIAIDLNIHFGKFLGLSMIKILIL